MADPVSQVTDLSVAAANGTMTIVEDTASTTGRDPVKISPLANDTGNHLQLDSFISDPTATFPDHGFITVKGSTVTYTPEAGFEGTDTFRYSVHDSAGDSQYGIISVGVSHNPLPSGAVAPTANTDNFTVGNTSTAKLDVIANDDSGDGSKLLVTGSNEPHHGTVELKGNELLYHPDSGFTGHDQLFYKIFNGTGLSDVGQVNLTVEQGSGGGGGGGGGGGQTLTVHNDSFKIPADTGTDLNVLQNDKGAALAVTQTTDAAHGTVVIDQNGTGVTYTPDQGFHGKDTFTYTASDGSDSGTATVKLNVQGSGSGQDHTVSVHNDSFKIPGGVDSDLNVLQNDKGTDLAVTQTTDAAHGTVTIDQNGTGITYTPDQGFHGKDTFTYTASDGSDSGTATVKLNVQGSGGEDNNLSAHNDSFKIPADTGTDLNVLVNDKGPGLTIADASEPQHGTVAIANDGSSITYTPDQGFHGKDSFTYTAMDSNHNTAEATVKLNVKGSSSSGSALKLSDVLSTDHDIGSSRSHADGGSSSHASVASVSMASSSVDLDTLVHQAHHHIG